MRILFFSHYFPPEGNAPASRTYEHCVRWVREGHSVTVITCVPNVPNGIPYDGFQNRFPFRCEIVDGIRVIRVWSLLAANSGFVRRILNYVSYMIMAAGVGLWVRRPDIIIATSPQFFCGWAGVIVQFVRRLPFVLEIRDIWPESITAVGAMKRGTVIRVLEWLEKRMYASADRIVAVGRGYKSNIVGKTVTPVDVIYNGVDKDRFKPQSKNGELLSEIGMRGQFICAYVGTIGMAHGLETVLGAAECLKRNQTTDVGFLFVGEGANKASLVEQVRNRCLTDFVKFVDRLPKEKVPQVIASSDAILVHLRPCDLFETVIPSKIFEAMAMQKPIIIGVRGESAKIVVDANAGLSMIPGEPNSLVECISKIKQNPAVFAGGRKRVVENFDRDVLAHRYLQILIQMVRS